MECADSYIIKNNLKKVKDQGLGENLKLESKPISFLGPFRSYSSLLASVPIYIWLSSIWF